MAALTDVAQDVSPGLQATSTVWVVVTAAERRSVVATEGHAEERDAPGVDDGVPRAAGRPGITAVATWDSSVLVPPVPSGASMSND